MTEKEPYLGCLSSIYDVMMRRPLRKALDALTYSLGKILYAVCLVVLLDLLPQPACFQLARHIVDRMSVNAAIFLQGVYT